MRTQFDDISDNMGCLTYMFLFFFGVFGPPAVFINVYPHLEGDDQVDTIIKIWVVISFLALHLYATGTFKKKK